MSAAFARLARGSATVMHDSADWADPPMDGIFGRIEVPNISEYTDVEEVSQILRSCPACDQGADCLGSYGPSMMLPAELRCVVTSTACHRTIDRCGWHSSGCIRQICRCESKVSCRGRKHCSRSVPLKMWIGVLEREIGGMNEHSHCDI